MSGVTRHKLEVLAELADTVAARRSASPDISYTAKLLSQGIEKCAKKVGEEGIEVAVAALAQDDSRVLSEMADLVYHGLVLLAARGLTWEQVEAELARRFK